MNQQLQAKEGQGNGVDVLKVKMIRSRIISLKLRETPMMMHHHHH
jgi:hypothetical protein